MNGIAKVIRARRLWLAGALAVAFTIRVWGIQHDLPFTYFGDEEHFVKRALSFGSGDLNPHWFHKPAFYMYVLFFEYGLYFLGGELTGAWASVDEFAVAYILDPSAFYLIGRFTTLSFALASLVAAYRIGEKHFAIGAGVVAAFMLALTYGHVDSSRVVKADIPAACLGMWSLYFFLNYIRYARRSRLVIAAILAGAGAATKYYPILMLVPILIAPLLVARSHPNRICWRSLKKRLVLSAIGVACFCAAYFCCSPFNFLDARGRARTFAPAYVLIERTQDLVKGPTEEKPDDFINESQSLPKGSLSYLQSICDKTGMGPVIGAICLAGLGVSLAMGNRTQRLFCAYAVLFAAASLFTYPGYAAPRHQVPLYCLLVVPGGALLASALRRIPPSRRQVGYAALAASLCIPAAANMSRSAELSRVDTRSQGRVWIESKIPPGTRLLVSESGPWLLSGGSSLDQQIRVAESADPAGQFTAHFSAYLDCTRLAAERNPWYDVYEIRLPWWRQSLTGEGLFVLDSDYDRDMGNPLKPLGVESYDYYVRKGFQYAVVHSDQYYRFPPSSSPGSDSMVRRFFQDLFRYGRLVEEFAPDGHRSRGPVVKVIEFAARQDVERRTSNANR